MTIWPDKQIVGPGGASVNHLDAPHAHEVKLPRFHCGQPGCVGHGDSVAKCVADSGPHTHAHQCKYCPDEGAHPDGFCICKHCGVRLGLSPAREAKRATAGAPRPTEAMAEGYSTLRQGLRMALWRNDFWPNNPGVGDDEIVEAVGRLMDERAAAQPDIPCIQKGCRKPSGHKGRHTDGTLPGHVHPSHDFHSTSESDGECTECGVEYDTDKARQQCTPASAASSASGSEVAARHPAQGGADDAARLETNRELLAAVETLVARVAHLFMGPKVVCLCGSTRFYDEYQQANYEETMLGHIVLSVGFFPHSQIQAHGGEVSCTVEQKRLLDELHLRKIDAADEILVLNVGGYVGESTAGEIAYAKAHGKVVRFLEAPDGP